MFENQKSAFPLFWIGFSVGPKFLLEMDGPRYRSINNPKPTEDNASELKASSDASSNNRVYPVISNESVDANEENHEL